MESGNEEKSLSRRKFIGGALVAGAAAVGAAALAGCSEASSNEATEAPEGNGAGTESAPGKRYADGWVDTENTAPIKPVAAPSAWDKEADVVIVGAGGGGLVASARLAQEGLKVILVEKASHIGGSSQEGSVIEAYGGVDRLWEDNWGYYGTPYNPKDVIDAFLEESMGSVNRQLLVSLVDAGPRTWEFLLDCGVHLQTTSYASYYLGPEETMKDTPTRKQKAVTDTLGAFAESEGAEIILELAASTLITDGGRVVGVLAKEGNGKELYIHANKAVLLTAGGMACNRDMLLRYIHSCGVGAATSTLMPTTTGECIRMGLGLNAAISGLGSYSMRDGGIEFPEGSTSMFRSSRDGAEILARQPWLNINKIGQQLIYYTTVNTNVGEAEAKASAQEMYTFGNRRIVLFDGNFLDYTTKFQEVGARVLLTPDMPGVANTPESLVDHNWYDGFERGVKDGIIKQADTLDELAELLDMDASVLQQSVADWNDLVAGNVDPTEWGYEKQWLTPIDTAPFYGIKISGAIQGTFAGLAVDPDLRVIDEAGHIIPGLYAGFMTAGGSMGENLMEEGIYGDVGLSYVGGYIASSGILKNE